MPDLLKTATGEDQNELIAFCFNMMKSVKGLQLKDIVGDDPSAREILGKQGKTQASAIILGLQQTVQRIDKQTAKHTDGIAELSQRLSDVEANVGDMELLK